MYLTEGTGGTSNISLSGPSGIVSDSSSGTIFIADTFNHRIVSYPAGKIVAGGNAAGNNDTQLYNPYGLVYDSISTSFVIPNYYTNNIVRWTLGATTRTVIAGNIMGIGGIDSISLKSPVGLTVDPMGNIYVADSDNHRIQFFLAGQSNATTIAGITGISGNNSIQLSFPYWVTLDNQLNLYVSDTFNNRVQKFLRY